jgi:hypothetical protein
MYLCFFQFLDMAVLLLLTFLCNVDRQMVSLEHVAQQVESRQATHW